MNFHFDLELLEEPVMMLLPMLTSTVPSVLLSIAAYVLSSMALYTLAVRRGIERPWLSWVPVLNVWILGSLSDQYRYVVKGQIKSKRKILLALNLVNLLALGILAAAAAGVVVDLIHGAVYGIGEEELLDMLLGTVLGAAGIAVLMSAVAIAGAVVRYMALYDLYTSMDPENSVLFLVLSILFQVTEPFFLFFSRNKDGGMPPRKPTPQSQSREPDPEGWEVPKAYS